MNTTHYLESLSKKKHDEILTIEELACALYEGFPHLQNLAEKLARQHSGAGALTFFDMNYPEVKNFWMNIAQQIIDHSKGWEPRQSGGCGLKPDELERLKTLPQYPGSKGDDSDLDLPSNYPKGSPKNPTRFA